MNNFAWAAIMLFKFPGTSQAYFGGFKDWYQRGYYCRKRLYSQISLKVWDSEGKLAFSSRLPLRRHIARWGTFSVDPGILVSLYASAHHPYTTLATGEWMIFWPSEDNPIEVGPTECSRHLEIRSSLHVRLLPATLQLYTTCRDVYAGVACGCCMGHMVVVLKHTPMHPYLVPILFHQFIPTFFLIFAKFFLMCL